MDKDLRQQKLRLEQVQKVETLLGDKNNLQFISKEKLKEVFKINKEAQLVILDNAHFKELHDEAYKALQEDMQVPSMEQLFTLVKRNGEIKRKCFG